MWVPLVFLFIITCRSSTSLGVHEENVGYRTHLRPSSQFGEAAKDWLRGVRDRVIGWVLNLVTPNVPKIDVEFRDYGYSDYNYDYNTQLRKLADPCRWDDLPTEIDEPKRTTIIMDWSYNFGSLADLTEPTPTQLTPESFYYDMGEDARDDPTPPSATMQTVLTTRNEKPSSVDFVSTTPTTQTDIPPILTTSTFSSTTQSISEKGEPVPRTFITEMPMSERSSSENLEPESYTSTTRMPTTDSSISENLEPESYTSTTRMQTTDSSMSENLEPELYTFTTRMQTTDSSISENLEPESYTSTTRMQTTDSSMSENLEPELYTFTTRMQTTDSSMPENLEPESYKSTTRMQTTDSAPSESLEPELYQSTTRMQTMDLTTSESLEPESYTSTTRMQTTDSSTSESLEPESYTSTTRIQTTSWSSFENSEPESYPSTEQMQTTPESTTFRSLFSTTGNIFDDTTITTTTEATSQDSGNTQYVPITIMTDSTSYSPTGETVTENDPPPVTMPVTVYDSDASVPNDLRTTTPAITEPTVNGQEESISFEITGSPSTQTTILASRPTYEISTTEEPQSQMTTPTVNAVSSDENVANLQTTNLPSTTTPITIFTTKKAKVEDNEVYKRRNSRKPVRTGSVEVLLPEY